MMAPMRPPRSKISLSPMPSSSVKMKKPIERSGEAEQDRDEEAARDPSREAGLWR